MFCSKCGNVINSNKLSCSKCRTKVILEDYSKTDLNFNLVSKPVMEKDNDRPILPVSKNAK